MNKYEKISREKNEKSESKQLTREQIQKRIGEIDNKLKELKQSAGKNTEAERMNLWLEKEFLQLQLKVMDLKDKIRGLEKKGGQQEILLDLQKKVEIVEKTFDLKDKQNYGKGIWSEEVKRIEEIVERLEQHPNKEGKKVMPTQGEKREEIKRREIEEATTFNELYQVVKQMGEIRGSSSTYTSEQIINLIKATRAVHENGAFLLGGKISNDYLNNITRSLGLRDKVMNLLKREAGQKERK